jgi:hypothetical protein
VRFRGIAVALALGGGPLGCTDGDTSTSDPLISSVSGPITCADPTARETAPLAPEQRTVLGDGGAWRFAADYHTSTWDLRWGGRGVVVADFDGDGLLDIIAPQTLEPTRLLLGNADGTWTERELPEADGITGAVGGSAADFDGDGDLDVFLYGLLKSLDPGATDAGVPPVLLVNDGTGTFTGESHPEWEEPEFMGCGGSASWADFDLDGDLDLFYGRLGLVREVEGYVPCRKRLLENQGDGTFVDVADTWFGDDIQQLRVLASGWHPAWDGDHWPELYVVADAILEGTDPELVPPGMSNLLYDNGPQGLGRLPLPSIEKRLAGMGLAAEDLDADGIVDVLVPGVDELPLLVSTSPTVWTDHADVWGAIPDGTRGQSSGWGGEFADLDNDGNLDLVLTFGSFANATPEPDEIYRWTGPPPAEDDGGGFEPVGEAWGFSDDAPNRGMIVADLDGNGWLDIVKREIGGVVWVDVANCGPEGWLEIQLDGPGLNSRAIGATVRVDVGDTTWSRTIAAGSTSFASGGPPVAHFGLGDADQVDRIEVTWPDGTETTHGPQDTRQILKIRHPSTAR